MTGTDRTNEFSGECPCGKGQLTINHCSPDQAYRIPYPEWYESSIDCASCAAKYDIVQSGKKFNLVLRSDVARIAVKSAECANAATKLARQAEAKGVMSAVAKLLDSQPSVAAIYRLVSRCGLEFNTSLPTFRRRWQQARNADGWLKAKGSGYQVGKMLDLLRLDDAQLMAAAAHLDQLRQESHAKPAPIEPAFHTLD